MSFKDQCFQYKYLVDLTNSFTSESKLPKLSAELVPLVPASNPVLHDGRIRSSPHVEGQYAAFVYVPVAVDKVLEDILKSSMSEAKKIVPSLRSDWLENSAPTELHISLSRPIYLRHHQREDIKRAVKSVALSHSPCVSIFLPSEVG